MAKTPRVCKCEAFDGWVTRADFRVGARVWGQNGPACQRSDADTVLIYRDPKKMTALATVPRHETGFWTIQIRSTCSWHYHKKEA